MASLLDADNNGLALNVPDKSQLDSIRKSVHNFIHLELGFNLVVNDTAVDTLDYIVCNISISFYKVNFCSYLCNTSIGFSVTILFPFPFPIPIPISIPIPIPIHVRRF